MVMKPFNRKAIELRKGIRKGIKWRREILERRIAGRRLVLSAEVISALDAASVEKTDFDSVSELLISGNRETRISASLCIRELAHAWLGNSAYIRDDATRPRLHAALNDNVKEVQRNIIYALADCHFCSADDALPILKYELQNPISEIRVATLSAIQSFGVDQASMFVKEICELVDDPEPKVHELACRVLTSFGRDAGDAIPVLCKSLLGTDNENARTSITMAISKIDPLGLLLLKYAGEPRMRTVLVNELRRLGSSGRRLRQALADCWSDNDGTILDGTAAYTLKQLAKLLNCTVRTVSRKIKDGTVPVIRKNGRAYHINALVLDHLIKGGGFGRNN